MVAWSYSSLTAFETCPKRYYLTRVSKEAVEPETEATRWGKEVHKALENRVRDKTPLPDSLAKHEGLVASMESKGDLFAETQIAIDKDFQVTEWFAKDVWCRAVIDVHFINGDIGVEFDWKTGKVKPDSDQLELSAALLFHKHAELQTVKTGFLWLAHDSLTQAVFTREQLPEIWNNFLPRVHRLELAYQENKWVHKPSGLCRKWCPVGRALCAFCGG